jgi:hypothetical protein
VQALIAVLQSELSNLPPTLPNQPATLQGEAHKFNGKASDEMEWLTRAGNGLFTQAAEGPWKVTLVLRPSDKTYTLGLLRKLPDNTSKEEHWLPLLANVDAIEIRYLSHGSNKWQDRWPGGGPPPTLVRVRIWRTDQIVPYEAVIELPPLGQLPT